MAFYIQVYAGAKRTNGLYVLLDQCHGLESFHNIAEILSSTGVVDSLFDQPTAHFRERSIRFVNRYKKGTKKK